MQLQIAFLRGINVGGHTVKMHDLRRIFESIGLRNVQTVIASGNVVFETNGKGGRSLGQKIEKALKEELGYEVATFLRTAPELAAVADNQPFDASEMTPGAVVYALFLRQRPEPEVEEALKRLKTGNDEVRCGTRELYWLRRAPGKESDVFGTLLGKTLRAETTSRNMNTVRRIVEKYCR